MESPEDYVQTAVALEDEERTAAKPLERSAEPGAMMHEQHRAAEIGEGPYGATAVADAKGTSFQVQLQGTEAESANDAGKALAWLAQVDARMAQAYEEDPAGTQQIEGRSTFASRYHNATARLRAAERMADEGQCTEAREIVASVCASFGTITPGAKKDDTRQPKEEGKARGRAAAPVPFRRTRKLEGATYQIKPDGDDTRALYVTVNDTVEQDSEGRPHKRPVEVFINTRERDHQQWSTALTRVTSAVMRKGGDVRFLIEEFESIHDPEGGYWEGGRYVPSLVAGIGQVLREHMEEGT